MPWEVVPYSFLLQLIDRAPQSVSYMQETILHIDSAVV
jgi:hypothetical protein